MEMLDHGGDVEPPEDDVVAAPDPGQAGTPVAASDPGTGRRPWWRRPLTVTVAALVAVTAVTTVVAQARERDRDAALAAMPGLLPSLSEPLRPLWHRPGSFGLSVPRPGESGDLMLLNEVGNTTAVDQSTGVVVWSRTVATGEHCWPQEFVEPPAGTTATEPPAQPAIVSFLVCQPSYVVGAAEPAFGPVTVDLLDPGSGEVYRTFTTSGAGLSVLAHESELWLMTITPDGRVRAVRWDVPTGDLLSDITGVPQVFWPGEVRGLDVQSSEPDGVVLVEATGRVAFSLSTGLEVEAPDVLDTGVNSDGFTDVPLAGGDTVHLRLDDDTTVSGTVLRPDGTTRFDLPGGLVRPAIDDGSLADVLVVVDDGRQELVGLDAATGRRLWARPMDPVTGLYPTLIVDGVLLLQGTASAEAIDGRDGRTLWTAASVEGARGLTDGRRALLAEGPPGGAPTALVARSLADGEVQWRVPLPHGTYDLSFVPGGPLIALTDQGTYAFG